jgi:thiamine transport system permease protein
MSTAVAFSALVSLGEFGVASLLTFGDQATIPVLMYQLISRPGAQNYAMALAVAAILTLITAVVVFLVSEEGTKKLRSR